MTVLKSKLVFHLGTYTDIFELNTFFFELTFAFTNDTLTFDNLVMSIFSLQYQFFFFYSTSTVFVRTVSDINSS